MCLLIAKQHGVEYGKISKAILNGAPGNPHGYGFALKRANSEVITIQKHFKTPQALVATLESLKVTKFDELMVHLRYATHGERNTGNAHPYAISRSGTFYLKDNFTTCMPVIGHNGIFHNYGTKELSDTDDFALRVLAEPSIFSAMMLNPESVFSNANITKDFGWSRVCVMFPHIEMIWYGDKYVYEGVYYSNEAFRGGSIPADAGFKVEKASQITTKTQTTTDNAAIITAANGEIELGFAPISEHIVSVQDIKVGTKATCVEYGENDEVSISSRIILPKTKPDTLLTPEDLEPHFSDKILGYVHDAKYNLNSLRKIYSRILHLQNICNKKFVFCEFMVPNLTTTTAALEFIRNDIRKRFGNEKYGNFISSIPQYLIRAGSVQVDSSNSGERIIGFDIHSSYLDTILKHREWYFLISKINLDAIHIGDKFVIDKIDEEIAEDGTTSETMVTLENVDNATRVYIASEMLIDNFRATYDLNGVEQYTKHPFSTVLKDLPN